MARVGLGLTGPGELPGPSPGPGHIQALPFPSRATMHTCLPKHVFFLCPDMSVNIKHDFKVAALWAFCTCLSISSHPHDFKCHCSPRHRPLLWLSLIARQNHNHQSWPLPSPLLCHLRCPLPSQSLFRKWVSHPLPALARFPTSALAPPDPPLAHIHTSRRCWHAQP